MNSSIYIANSNCTKVTDMLIKNNIIAGWFLDLETFEFTVISKALHEILGTTPQSPCSYEFFLNKILLLEDRDRIERGRLQILSGEKQIQIKKFRAYKQDSGEILLVSTDCFAVYDDDGKKLKGIRGNLWIDSL